MTALLTDNLPLLAGAPNGIQKLRELILELAVRGKLVPQDPSDEPVSELLKRIAEEKARLVAEGKIRKQKPLAEIGEEEKPFELPEGWEWCRLVDCSKLVTDGEHITPARTADTSQVPLVTAKNVRDGYMDYSVTDFVDWSVAEKCWERCRPEVGDIMMVSVGATLGRLTVLPESKDMVIVRSVTLIKPLLVSAQYLALTIRSPFVQQLIWGGVKQSAQPCLYLSQSTQLLMAIPPLPEQHRIVAKVDELMALCDRLEACQADAESAHARLVQALLDSLTQASDADDFAASWQRLAEHFHSLFTSESSIAALRKTLLHLGADGRLVATMGPAEYVTISDVMDGDSLNGCSKKPQDSPGAVEILRISAGTGSDSFLTDETDHKWADVSQAEIEKFSLKKYDLLACRFNGNLHYVGAFSLYCAGRGVPQIFPDKLIRFRANLAKALPHYLKYILNATPARTQIESFCATTVGNIGISAKNLKTIKVRLPSLAEQQRIVAKLDQLMALCDQLKARLTTARQLHERLAGALVEQAVA